MCPESDRLCPAGVCQKTAVQVIFERGCGHLGQVVLGLILIQKLCKFRPAHAFRIAVHHFDFVDRMQKGSHLRQRDLRPDHILARAPADPVLGADPQPAIGGGRVDEHDVHRIFRAGGGQKSLADDRVCIREVHHSKLGRQTTSKIDRVNTIILVTHFVLSCSINDKITLYQTHVLPG